MIRTALQFLLLGLATAPALAQAPQPAGRVLLSVGEVVAERGGQRVPLALNAPVFQGDTIRLGASSNAQVRLSDQSVVALRERTAFRIDEYKFDGGEEGRGIFTLLAGGMRTVTGLIGRTVGQRGNYAVNTPTSTIGIRGTHYTLVHCNNDCNAPSASALLAQAGGGTATDAPLQLAQAGGPAVANGTYGGVTDGRISAAPNQAPQLGREFGHDEYFFVANASTAPQSLIAPPSFLHDRLSGQSRTQGQKGSESSETLAQGGINAESRPNSVPEGPKPSTFVVTEQKTPTGTTTVVASTVATHGGLVAFRGADGKMSGGGAFITPSMVSVTASGADKYVASINIPVGTVTTDNPIAAPGAVGTLTGSVTDLFIGSSVEILMGRWTSGTFTDDTGTSSLQGGLHFIYGPLTPPDSIAAKTGTFNFSSVAATTPTHSGGLSLLSGAFPGSLTVNFTSRNVSVPGSTLTFGSQTWFLPASSGPIKIVSGVGASFDTGNVTGGSCSGGGCTGNVTVQASGIFLGTAASQHLGVVFGATNSASQTLQGAKVYQCSGC